MKKLLLFLFVIVSTFANSQVTPLNVVQYPSNTVNTNTFSIGNKANRSMYIKNNPPAHGYVKFDSLNRVTIYADTNDYQPALVVRGTYNNNAYMQLRCHNSSAYRLLNNVTNAEWYWQNQTYGGGIGLDGIGIGRTQNPSACFVQVGYRGKFVIQNYRSNTQADRFIVDTARIYNNLPVSIGTVVAQSSYSFHNVGASLFTNSVVVGIGSTRTIFGNYSSTIPAFWMRSSGQYTTTTNYNLGRSTTSFLINDSNKVNFAISDATIFSMTSLGVPFNTHVKIGASSAPGTASPTLELIGNASISSSLAVGGVSLSAGGFTVNSKSINTTSGDAATIDSPVGRFRKDATGTTFVLTDAFITANSIIVLTCADAGADTQRVYGIVATAGSATITFYNYVLGVATATAPSANSDINFIIMN